MTRSGQGPASFLERRNMALKLMYITNDKNVALIAQKYGVDRVWIDLETVGKEKRQPGNTVKSQHSMSDIEEIKPLLTTSELLVRVNPWSSTSYEEIESVIEAGADIVMLPMWKTVNEVKSFIKAVDNRCKTILLLETKEAVDCIDEVLLTGGFDEIHIGLNDLHLSYGMNFMFEPLANGLVEELCKKFKDADVPYGFGGIAKLGDGILPAERIIMEHYRLGSTRTILSRTFCDASQVDDISEIDKVFKINMNRLRLYEKSLMDAPKEEFEKNRQSIIESVDCIVDKIITDKKEEMQCQAS